MGLIKAAAGAFGGTMADQWKEFFYCDAIDKDVLVVKGEKRVGGRSSNKKGSDNIISSGSGIAVADGQCMIIVEQGKVVEVCAEPGQFTYDASTEPSIFAGSLGEGIHRTFDPDHTHAVIAAYAMKAGKHVFVEKPMAKTIYETRFLRDLAKQTGVVTQMGNQGHNIEGTMQTVEWIQGGVIGDVKEVHLWTNRPMWRQGYFDRPAGVDIPSNLNYDVWLGPAPDKPYNPEMLHFAWRGLWDYGTGAMGDMGAHTFDAPIWALNLGMPTKIQATSTPYNKDYLPQSECVTYEFPARGNMPPVKVTWSDGGIKPARPAELEPNRQLREALYIGDKGLIMHGTHGAEPQLIPERPGFVAPEKTLKRPSNIYVDFIEAIKEGRKAANDFEVSAKLTEIMLLTNIAVAAQRLDLTLEYDAENMRITNCPEANDYFHYEYRKGWSL